MNPSEVKIDVSTMFQRADDKKESEATSVLLYGSKCGKSVQIGTLGDRTLWLCLDPDGYASIKSPWFRATFGHVNPIIVEIYEQVVKKLTDAPEFSTPDIAIVYDLLYEVLNYAFKNRLNDFDHVALDSATSLSRSALLKALDVNAATRRSQTKQNIVQKMNAILPAMQDYGTEMSLVQQLIDQLLMNCKMYNKNLIVTAHERHVFKKNTMGVEEYVGIRPMFTGRTAPDNISQAFSNVWYMRRVGKGVFRLYTQGDGDFIASSRNAGLWGDMVPDTDKVSMTKFPNGPNIATMLADIKKVA